MLFKSKKSLARACALACTTIFAGAAQAIVVGEQFDGSWYNATQGGRGLLVDVIPGASGNTFFGALFSYDAAGNPIWLSFQPVLTEGQFSATNFEVRRFQGGSFGNTFTAPNPAAGTVIGTANLVVNNCNSLQLDITPNANANLSNVNLSLERLEGPQSLAQCAWSKSFTACPAGTTAVAGSARTCLLPAVISSNLTLTNDASYVISGQVQVGAGRNTGSANLTIEPGTRIQGSGGAIDYLVVQPGSKIFAEGNVNAPIVFTGPTETPGSWAGIVIAGNAPNNACTGTTPCSFEAVTSVQFGGTNAADSSGVLRYVQIRNAGKEIRANEELNSLTLLGVGNGTVIDYVQTHAGKDDGFEMFGGTVNLTHVVATQIEDDMFDMDQGYVGKIQYAYGRQTTGIGTDSNGIESDNNNSNNDLLPRTRPTIANMTLIGAAGGNEGMRLRRGTAGNYFNIVVSGFAGECLNFNDTATYTAAGTPAALTGNTTMQGARLACGTQFEDSASDPFLVSAWFNAQALNNLGDAGLTANRFPTATSPLLSGAASVTDSFFETTSYRGAFSGPGADWAAGWTLNGSL